jgi:phosphatidate cytidylyltransferase
MSELDDDGARRFRHAAPGGAQDYGRAGRNVPLSLLTGVVLLAVVLVPLFFFKPAFIVVIVLASCVGVWEMVRAVRPSGPQPALVPLLGGTAAMVLLAWYAGLEGLSTGLLVASLAALVWRMADGPENYLRDMGSSVLILVYVPFLLGFAVLLVEPADGSWRVFAALLAVVLSDTGGYVAGVLFGKHPMAPSISPKKSWEGFAGSIVATAVGGALLLWLAFDAALWKGAVFGLVISCAAVLGDLTESLLKRDLGIKDMSDLLPAHGGLMDRLDSIVFAVPTAYLLLSVLVPVA